MAERIEAVYERGVLRPLKPLSLPESTRVEIQIVAQSPSGSDERQRVRRALIGAGVTLAHPPAEAVIAVSEKDLEEAGKRLAAAGSLSDLIIAEREGR